jgi:hypothetical protein
MRRTSIVGHLLLALGVALFAACGSSTFDGSGNVAGEAGAGAATGGKGAAGGNGGSGGSSGSSSGTSGSSSGGGGTDAGASGRGASTGGTTGGGGMGGSTGGVGGSSAGVGGSSAGVGGSSAGVGGAVAGSAGCGFCPFVACPPAVSVTVTGTDQLANLQGKVVDTATSTTLGELICYPNGGTPCAWSCQLYQLSNGSGHYSIELDAPGYASKAIEFSVSTPTNCGCCGCGCTAAFDDSTELEPDGSEIPNCCAALSTDSRNCGTCGNICDSGYTCTDGECTEICSLDGAGCANVNYMCCAGLTCCPPDSLGQRQCRATCP